MDEARRYQVLRSKRSGLLIQFDDLFCPVFACSAQPNDSALIFVGCEDVCEQDTVLCANVNYAEGFRERVLRAIWSRK